MGKDIGPGEWSSEELDEGRSEIIHPNWQVEYSDSLIAPLEAFRTGVYNPQHVFYPCCGYDGSPAKVFDRVTFVDLERDNKGCVEALRALGYDALSIDVREYVPSGKHDLLLLQNPDMNPEWATPHLVSGGWIIANDYHSTAAALNAKPEGYLLWGTIGPVRDGAGERGKIVVSRDLEDLFVPVKDFAEFESLRPDDAEFTRGLVEGLYGGANFERQFARYREKFMQGKPFKRVAENYIFIKK